MKRDILKVKRLGHSTYSMRLIKCFGRYKMRKAERSSSHHTASSISYLKDKEHRAARRALNKTALYCVHYGSHGKIGKEVINEPDANN